MANKPNSDSDLIPKHTHTHTASTWSWSGCTGLCSFHSDSRRWCLSGHACASWWAWSSAWQSHSGTGSPLDTHTHTRGSVNIRMNPKQNTGNWYLGDHWNPLRAEWSRTGWGGESYPPQCPMGKAFLSLSGLWPPPQYCCRSRQKECSPKTHTQAVFMGGG